jgi:hypothetical protein
LQKYFKWPAPYYRVGFLEIQIIFYPPTGWKPLSSWVELPYDQSLTYLSEVASLGGGVL